MDLRTVALLAFVFSLVAVVAAIGYWILHPLDLAARHYRHPMQFTLVDFLALMLLIQLPMGLIHWLAIPDERHVVWVLDVFVWVAAGLMWWMSVSTLSRAGIHDTWQRGIFLSLVLPVAYFGSIASVILPLAFCSLLSEGRPQMALVLAAIEMVLIGCFFLAARHTRALLARRTIQQGKSTASSDEAPW